MVKTTKAQRRAIKSVFDRQPLFIPVENGEIRMSYRKFRREVQPTIGCDGAVIVFWARMWLCIERDGYVHS